MKYFNNPAKPQWVSLIQRPVLNCEHLEATVSEIIQEVKTAGDKALRIFACRFDKADIENIHVDADEIKEASLQVSEELKAAISVAANNIRAFHISQINEEPFVETTKGIICWRKSVPIENVGLYIPGGSAPLFSTILMLAIPAQIAGCKRIAVCTPCGQNGKVHPAVLYTASSLGITEIYKVGGAQSIAALAYGTECIPKVDKIFGPGNRYVTKAKELVQKSGVAIDLPAGPSEVLVIADNKADAGFIASDLLAQAEHGTDSQVVFVTNEQSLVDDVNLALEEQLRFLPRAELAKKALDNSLSVRFNSIEECIAFSNAYAPEHLILSVENAENEIGKIQNAGSVFLGNYSCESAGDYASGTNHTLPTNGYARSYSGVSLDSFVKKITFQKITAEGLKNIGKTIEIMAEAEQLIAHKNAVSIRLKKINNE